MTSLHSSASVIAVHAVTGEFLGRRTLVSGAVLTAVAAWGGHHLGASAGGYSTQVATTGVLLATAGTVSSIAWTWVLSGRWHTMMLLPVQVRDLTRAVYAVGMLVALIEAILPASAFAVTGLGASPATVVPMAGLGLGAAPLIILLWGATSWRHRLGAGAALAAAVAAGVGAGPAYGAVLALTAAAVCLAAGPGMGSDRTREPWRHGLTASWLVLGELLRSPMAQVNSLVLLGAGTVLNLALQRHGSPWLIGVVLVVVNTPVSSYFSRNPSTWLTVRTCPRTWLTYWRFGTELTVYYAACATAVTLAPGWSPTQTPPNLAAALMAAVAAAATAATLEMHRPLTTWKSEREVLRHPRKYLPGIAACLAASCGWILF